MEKRILIGISSCLLGEKVRFDGGHKRDNYICDMLADYVEFLPICPEADIGMGIPRPPIRLVGNPQSPQLVEVKNPQKDYTQPMLAYANQAMERLGSISGYILKSKSPTCGWTRVKVYQGKDQPTHTGTGLFAQVLEQHYPDLPIEEEGRLNDPRLRENFIERLFVYKDWQDMLAEGLTADRLVKFHTRHKLTLMAHHPSKSRTLGQKMAQLKHLDLQSFSDEYIRDFMLILRHIATTKKQTNVLHHCFGYFKKVLDKTDKQEMVEAIEQYRLGLVPLIVPITLLKHHIRHYPQPYLQQQHYLSPYPAELMLRNHI